MCNWRYIYVGVFNCKVEKNVDLFKAGVTVVKHCDVSSWHELNELD